MTQNPKAESVRTGDVLAVEFLAKANEEESTCPKKGHKHAEIIPEIGSRPDPIFAGFPLYATGK
jgi:hypothetical protein